MKNKIIIYILLQSIFFLNTNILSANDFTFNTNEINILDKGNIINAIDGFAKSVKDKIVIKADKFQYNKKLSFLKATNGIATLPKKNITIKADILRYEVNTSSIVALGNAEINASETNILIKSQNVFFDAKNNIIKSKKDTIISDNNGNIFFVEGFFYEISENILKITNAKIQDKEKNILNVKKAFINLKTNKLIGKDLSINFNNSSFPKDNEPRLSGVTISADKNQSTITKGVFTSCKKNDDCPPWQFSAGEIKHDKKNKIMFYKNAWLQLYNKPVFYFPKFFHPDMTVKRQSGFLMPSFQDSVSVGSSFGIPYYHVISDNKDFTIRPRLYSNQKFLIQSEYRQINKKSTHLIDFSYKNDGNLSGTSHFFSSTSKKIDIFNFDETELKLQLQKTSNDTYLKTYKLKSPLINDTNTLTSSLGISAYKENFSINADFNVYEDLSRKGSDRYEFVYPAYNMSKYFSNSNFTLNSSGSLKNYDTNVYETLIVNDLIYNSDPFFTDKGLKNNYTFLIKNVNTDSKNSGIYKENNDFKIMSIMEYNTSYPLKKEMVNYSNLFKPMISLKFSPNNTKDLKNIERRIDINNIFSINRIGRNDTVEGGASLTYGAKFAKINNDSKEEFGVNVANVFRISKNENLPTNSNLGKKTSAIVGDIIYSPNDIIKINYDFSIDNNLKDKNYELLTSELRINNFVTSFDYMNENNTKNKESYLGNKTKYKINDSKSLSFETRKNKKTKLTEFYNLIYQYRNDCLIAAIEYNRDYYTDRDLKPDESIFFKLTIIPFGETSSPNLMQ